MRLRTTVLSSLVVGASLVSASQAQAPPARLNPEDVGINYDIVAMKMPNPANPSPFHWQDAFGASLFIGAGANLVIIHPDGSEELLFSGGPGTSCVDPSVSYDGRTIFFSLYQNPTNINTQRESISREPAHIWKVDVATKTATQLTFGNELPWRDSANQIDPQYAPFDVAPLELPDGRILFLSTRDGAFAVTGRLPSPAFWRMNADGSNLERMEWFSMGGCQHPIILKDGRIVWTHRHDAGRRAPTGAHTYPLMVANQDLSDFKSFAGMHAPLSAWHFLTQMSDDDIVSCVYYHLNSCGHGPMVRFPASPGHPSGNDFGPVSQVPDPVQTQRYCFNDSFPRINEQLVTPWLVAKVWAALTEDQLAPMLPNGTRTGKTTMPAALPGGHLLFVWSAGGTHVRNQPLEWPQMKVCYAEDGWLPEHSDIVVLKEEAGYQYMHPRPIVPYIDVHGVPRPARQLDTPNDGQLSVLPAGGAFATTGTSSVYNRESDWPASYTDAWSQKLTNTFAQMTAIHTVGQDTYRFSNDDIHAAQVVVDMARVDSRYVNSYKDFASHNNGEQLWAVLGEIELRKFDTQGNPILDPNGDPDTSYEVRIPANTPFHHRLLDKNGLLLTGEWTWHNARPGERKTNCGGCHAHSVQTTPLSFDQTYAAQPLYSIPDFALQTPMIDQDAQGNMTTVVRPEKLRLVEYHKDVKPIFEAKCVSCHQGAQPAAGLDLSVSNAWQLAYGPDPLVPEPSGHQVTRYVRKNAATQSSLVWKVYGQRLDGRTNAERNDDWDYTGDIMPPPGSGVPALTYQEKRTIGLWVDLGCVVDLTPGRNTVSDPYDDQMKPTLVLSGVNTDYNEHPLPPLVVSAIDVHSGLDTSSLSVVLTPENGDPSSNLAAGIQLQEGMPVSINLLIEEPDRRYTIDVSVADQVGNISRRKLEVTPLSLRYSQTTPWLRNSMVSLKVEGAQPGELVNYLGSFTGPGAGPVAGPLRLDLLTPLFFLGGFPADQNGTVDLSFLLPANLPPFVFHTQAVVIRGFLGQNSVKTRPLWSELK